MARQIHDVGRRRKGPFNARNYAAIVETLLEHEGPLFLDDVSDLSPEATAKLPRAI